MRDKQWSAKPTNIQRQVKHAALGIIRTINHGQTHLSQESTAVEIYSIASCLI